MRDFRPLGSFHRLPFLLPVLFALLLASPSQAVTVSLPLTIDYPMLTTLYRRAFFPAGADNLALADEGDGCNYLYLSDPRFAAQGAYLRLDLRVAARLGAAVGDHCLAPAPWRGQISLLLRPHLNGQNFVLTFSVADSTLLAPDGHPDRMASVLWNFVSPLIFRHADTISFNLAPPVRDLRNFLPSLFPFQTPEQSRQMINSLAGEAAVVKADGLAVSLRLDVPASRAPVSGAAPSDAELERAVRLWEKWDSLLVRMLAVFNPRLLRAEDKELLSDILLNTRYAFVTALDSRKVGQDFVRAQFLAAWQRMAPIFHQRAAVEAGDNPWGYLSFLTAADALKTCDALGPALGVEISERGLVSLAQMLGGKSLNYSGDVQPFLRDLMTLPETQPQPAAAVPETTLPPDNNFIEGDLPKEKTGPDAGEAKSKPETEGQEPPAQIVPPAMPPHEEQPAQPPGQPPTEPSVTPRTAMPDAEPDIPAPLPEPSAKKPTQTSPPAAANPPGPSPKPPTESPTEPSRQEINSNPQPEKSAPNADEPRSEEGKKEESQAVAPKVAMPPDGEHPTIPAPPSKPSVEPPKQSPVEAPSPPPARQDIEKDTPQNGQSGWWRHPQRLLISLADSICQPAMAATIPEPWRNENVMAWKTPPEDAATYLKKMLGILDATAKRQQGFSCLASPSDFLAAMAWQESCFRQFIPQNGRMTFVLSSNRTSVGLMQVNERVWRGLYDQERLRWDMPYNAAVGAEIAVLYLRQVQKKSGRLPPGNNMLEAAVYALYNGGPGQLDKFINRVKNGDLYKSDRLFLEKLGWSKSHAWSKAMSCLGNG